MTDTTYADKVWDILVDCVGAQESMRPYFTTAWPECVEFRFQGELGFGGKVWYHSELNPKVRVSCYREDDTPERLLMIRIANEKLAEL